MSKKAIILAISFILILSSTSFVSGAENSGKTSATYQDAKGHWASAAIEKWSGYGVLCGSNDLFRPNDYLTRGEMACILSSLMGYQKTAENQFSDLPAGAFYTDAILKANATGVLVGDGDSANPTDRITREEAAVMMAKSFAVECDTFTESIFQDIDAVSPWARTAVLDMEQEHYIVGAYGNYHPQDPITRAEVVSMINSIVKAYYTKPGTYTDPVDGTAVIKCPGVVLDGVAIAKDLIIAEGVGTGDATFHDVVVKGKTVARGGGENSLHIKGTSDLSKICIEKNGDKIRITVADGEAMSLEVAENEEIILTGTIGTLNIEADNATIYATDATVKTINITGKNTVVVVEKKSKIDTVNTHAICTIRGDGVLTTAYCYEGSENSSIVTPNTVIIVKTEVPEVTGGGGKAILGGKTAVNNAAGDDLVLKTARTRHSSNPPASPAPPAPHAAPTGLEGIAPTEVGDADGFITGASTAMEYKEESEPLVWTTVSGITITGLASGTYHVRYITDTNDGLVAEVVVPVDDDTYVSARWLTVGAAPVTQQIDPVGDEDWFKFSAADGKDYEIVTTDIAGGMDAYTMLYQPDGTTLEAEGDGNTLAWTCSGSGIYYLVVTHSIDGTGTYNIKVQDVTPLDITANYLEGMDIASGFVGGPQFVTFTNSNPEQWTAITVWNPDDDPLQSGVVYTLTITVIPNPGYTLEHIPANFFTLPPEDMAGVASVTNAAGSGVVTLVYEPVL